SPPAALPALRPVARWHPRRRAGDRRRRLQRLADARPRPGRSLWPGGSLHRIERSAGAHVSVAPSAADPGSHLPARRARQRSARAQGAPVVAPVRPRAARGTGGVVGMARVDDHELRLLENGEAFFARVGEAIAAARNEVLLESFILFEDKVGLALQRQLIDAARRGVRVEATVDGYGS